MRARPHVCMRARTYARGFGTRWEAVSGALGGSPAAGKGFWASD